MNGETAETIVTTWVDRVWNELDDAAIHELLAERALVHGLLPAPIVGPAGFRDFRDAFTAAFYDIRIDVDHQVVRDDEVAARFHGSMRHRASGTPVTFSAMVMARVEGGRIVEAWNSADFLPMLIALGVVAPDALDHALAPPEGESPA